MPWGAAIGAVGAIAGGLIASNGAQDAAHAQTQAAQQQMAFQKWLFHQQQKLQKPFRESGLRGLEDYLALLGIVSPGRGNVNDPNFGQYANGFTNKDFLQNKDPGYAFRLGEGLKAVDRQAAARGGLISGAALKASDRYAQDYASGEYTNAYNRYWNSRTNRLNELGTLFGAGQQATNQVQNAASQMGQAVGNAYSDIGNSRASSYAGQANAWGNAVNQLGNIGMDYYYMNQTPSPSSSGSGRSDARLKSNIRAIGTRGPLTLYKWTWNGLLGMRGEAQGYIAQEVAEVFPEAVSESDGYLMLDYSMLPRV